MIASLDALSGGRVLFGIGAGWVAAESAMLGVPFKERGAMTDEYLRAMQELWTSRAPTFEGAYTQFSGLDLSSLKPTQKPHPPIWAGGHSKPRCAAPSSSARPGIRSTGPWTSYAPVEAEIARLCQARGRTAVPALTLRNDVRILRPGETAPASAHAGRVPAGSPAALVGSDRRAGGHRRRAPRSCEFSPPTAASWRSRWPPSRTRVRPRLT